MGVISDMITLPARVQASNATQKAIFDVLKRYIEEVKSYGDELDVETFYDDFAEYYKKNWLAD